MSNFQENTTDKSKKSILIYKYFLYAILVGLFILLWESRLTKEYYFLRIYCYSSFAALVSIIFFLLKIYTSGREKYERKIYIPSNYTYFLILILAIFISTLLSPYKYGSILELLKFISCIAISFVLFNLFSIDKKSLDSFLKAIVIFGILSSIMGIFSLIGVSLFPKSYLSQIAIKYNFVLNGRVGSLLVYPNTYGVFLVFSFVALSLYGIKEQNFYKKILIYFGGSILLFSIYLTKSRGAVIFSLLPAILLETLLLKKERKLYIKFLFVSLAGAVFLIILDKLFIIQVFAQVSSSNNIINGIFFGKNGLSIQARIQFIKDALKMFASKPLFGYGPGTFKYEMVKFRPFSGFYSILPHSSILLFLSESGIFAGLAFTGIIFTAIIKWFKVKTGDLTDKIVYVSFVVMILHSLVDIDFLYSFIVTIIFLLSMHVSGTNTIQIKTKKFTIFSLIPASVFIVILIFAIPKAIASEYAVKGSEYLNNGNLIKSAYSYISALKHDFSNDYYHFKLAGIYRELSFAKTLSCDNKITFKELAEAMNLNKIDFNYPERSGILELALKKQNSEKYLNEAINLNPTDPDLPALKSLALIYTGNKRMQALKAANEVLLKKPDNSIALTTLGFYNLPANSAIKYFEQALESDKLNAFAYLGKALFFKSNGKLQEELESLFELTRISHCLSEGWELYLENAPKIDIISYKINKSVIQLHCTIKGKNANLIKSFEIKISDLYGKTIKILSTDNVNNLSIDLKNHSINKHVKISIIAIDSNGLPIAEIISAPIKLNFQ